MTRTHRPAAKPIVAAIVVTALTILFSCSSPVDGGTDSSSHWLSHCRETADCGALECVCGVCTKRCADNASCHGISANARCAPPEASGCGEASSVCVASSARDASLSAGDAAGAGGTPSDAAPEASQAATSDGGPTITYASAVLEADYVDGYFDASASAFANAVSGVEVCVVKPDGSKDTSVRCSTTDSSGRFSLTLPANKELIVMATKAGFRTEVVAVEAKDRDFLPDISMWGFRQRPPLVNSGTVSRIDAGLVAGLNSLLGTATAIFVRRTESFAGTTGNASTKCGLPPCGVTPANTGSFTFLAWVPATATPNGVDHSAPGVSVSLSPARGGGPFYADSRGDDAVPAATSTSDGGSGWYQDLPPGEYQITFTHPTMDCTWLSNAALGSTLGLQGRSPGDQGVSPIPPNGTTANVLRVPVIAGAHTQAITAWCAPRVP